MISRTEVQSSALSLQRRFERWFEGCTHFRVQTGQTSQSTSPRSLRQEHISGQGMFTSLAETLCTGYKHVLLLCKAGSASTGRYPFQPPNMPGLSPPLGVLRFIKFQ